MLKKTFRLSSLIALVLIPLLLMTGQAHAAMSNVSFTVDYPAPPLDPTWGGATITVSATLSQSTSWNSTSYSWDNWATSSCLNHNNENPDGGAAQVVQLTFDIAVPTNAGGTSPTLRVRAHQNSDSCSTQGGTDVSASNTANVPVAENNPPYPTACGLDVIFVMDESGSIDGGGSASDIRTEVRSGANSLWDALEGTGSTISIVEFNTTARQATNLQNLAVTQANQDAFLAPYLGPHTGGAPANSADRWEPGDYGSGQTYTNWEAAFLESDVVNGSAPKDLLIFFTDGNPTTNNDFPNASNPSSNFSNTTHRHLGPAAIAANAIKTTDQTRILGVGYANPNDPSDNLKYVSGPTVYDGTNITAADFTLSTNSLDDDLRAVVLAACSASVTVTKETFDFGSTAWVDADGWQYTAASNLTGGAFQWTAPSVTSDPTVNGTTGSGPNVTGSLLFQWDPETPTTTTHITIAETQKTGYDLVSVDCKDQTGADAGVPDALTVDFDVANNQFYTCAFRNRFYRDFGDHNISYNTLFASGGPYHVIYPDTDSNGLPNTSITDPAIWLGALIDQEADGIPNVGIGDNSDAQDDEDSAVPVNPQSWTVGTGGNIDVLINSSATGTQSACLVAWFDWGNTGNFAGAGDRTISEIVTWTTTTAETAVLKSFAFPIPAISRNDLAYRLRLFDISDEAACDQTALGGAATNGEVEDHIVPADHLPVSVTYFHGARSGNDVRFEWETAMETGNVGFNIYVETETGLQRINEELIPSHALNSFQPESYVYEANDVVGESFFIEDIDVRSEHSMHGPFLEGEIHGERLALEAIDWAAIRVEHEQKEAQREVAATARAAAALRAGAQISSGEGGAANQPLGFVLVDQIFLPVASGVQKGPAIDPVDPIEPDQPPKDLGIKFIVDRDGLYRVTYQDLKNAGFDLKDIDASALALLDGDLSIPIRVEAAGKFSQGSAIEFYGLGLDTLYTDSRNYRLMADSSRAQRIEDDITSVSSMPPAKYYMETALVDDQIAYDPLAGNGDPWIHTAMRSYSSPVTWALKFDTDNLYQGAEAPKSTLLVGMWGASEFNSIKGPNHHIQTKLNGVEVANASFKGTVDASFTVELNKGLLQEGSNTVEFTQVKDTGATYNVVNVDEYGALYPRAYVARDGGLTFEAAADAFRVEGLASGQVDVYRIVNGTPEQVQKVDVSGGGGAYSATFSGSAQPATYVVATEGAWKTPTIKAGRAYTDITSGSAEYLIISHPDFINGLGDLVAARKSDFSSVLVADVYDVYAQFSNENVDAQALKDYIAHAAKNMGTTHVLLVGGDTYDYRGYLNTGGVSFIPSLYVLTAGYKYFAPVDPLYADVYNRGVPALALGRFPVTNDAELALMVGKTLTYESNVAMTEAQGGYGGKAVFAADKNYENESDDMISKMGGAWDFEKVYLDQLEITAARLQLRQAIGNGKAVTSFIGHSGDVVWTPYSLLTASSAATLENHGLPTVVTQWGCWNTYFVEPSYKSMAHKFLLSGNNGAAVVLGATTVAYNTSEQKLGAYMMPGMVTPGVTVGEAMRAAKQQVYDDGNAHLIDVMLGWTLLGDPALVIQPNDQ